MAPRTRGWLVRLTALALCGALAASAVSAQTIPPLVGGAFTHVVKRGDTWQSIASRFGVDLTALAEMNGRTIKDRIRAGDSLAVDNRHIVPVPTPHAEIIINIPQRMLFVMRDERVVASYPVALGRPTWPTFVGPFTVLRTEIDPVWDVPPSIQEELRQAGKKVLTRVGPGPSNPLGKYWLGLSEPNYGIHGTIAPRSIYHFETHGCIRLHPDDIADLWTRVTVGTVGEIVYAPVLLTVNSDGTVLLEAHRNIYQRQVDEPEMTVRKRAQDLGVEARLDWDAVQWVLAARDGHPHDVTR